MPAPRPPAVAGLFYPASRKECLREIERCFAAASVPPGTRALAAVAPHAGWTYSGPTAARAVLAIEPDGPETVLLFGADHHGLLRGACSVFPGAAWGTPLGEVAVDSEVARALLDDPAARARPSAEAHAPEHSIEVLVPFLLHRLPEARIVPVIAPPGAGAATAGEAAARAATRLGRRVAALGSSDLTHYGARYGFEPEGTGAAAHRWSKEENDREILDRALALDSAGVEDSFRRRHNACGPGAMAAVAAAARALGATRGVLLEHTTSAEVLGERDPDMWVGYAAVAYVR